MARNKKSGKGAPKSVGTKSFTKNCKDAKALKKLLVSGKISKGCPPREILQTCPEHHQHKPESFRAQLRKIKTEIGFNVRDNDGKEEWLVVWL